jgi:hypothetical protein
MGEPRETLGDTDGIGLVLPGAGVDVGAARLANACVVDSYIHE